MFSPPSCNKTGYSHLCYCFLINLMTRLWCFAGWALEWATWKWHIPWTLVKPLSAEKACLISHPTFVDNNRRLHFLLGDFWQNKVLAYVQGFTFEFLPERSLDRSRIHGPQFWCTWLYYLVTRLLRRDRIWNKRELVPAVQSFKVLLVASHFFFSIK